MAIAELWPRTCNGSMSPFPFLAIGSGTMRNDIEKNGKVVGYATGQHEDQHRSRTHNEIREPLRKVG